MDLAKLEQLLNILEMIRNQPSLKPLHDLILDEVTGMADDHVAKQKEKEDAPRYTAGVRPGSSQAAGTSRL
jgi:hypothetical protein